MTIARGVLLGPYEILTPIGSGGMGEVWRARDRRIERDVAIKILADTFGVGDELVRRFEQEARAAGALNHPGLVTIFDVGTNEGSPYIVMELLDGETVRDAIDRSAPEPLAIRRTIDYAIQIAEALAVAHEKGIIHRDLKPENLFLTSDRRIKVLDFGLAKLAEAKDGGGKQRTGRHLTSAGIVVGTPGYMSPEQVRAQPLDHRTDIFSLGSVLYEMLSGHPAFERESAIETMHAVLSTEPAPLSTSRPEIPPALDAIVRHCMEKDARERFQSARDLAFQLRTMPEAQGTSHTDTRRISPAVVRPRRPWRVPVAVAAATAVLVAAGFGVAQLTRADAEAPIPRTFKQLTFDDGLQMFPTLSPDGKSFAYVSGPPGNRDIYVQRVDGRTPINVTGDSPDDDFEPAFSPDGSQIAFRSERSGGGIFVMGVTGESVRRLTDFGHNPSWAPDGSRLVVATVGIEMRPHIHGMNSQLWLIDARTGAKRVLVQPGGGGPDFGRGCDSVQPSWSPHGKRIAFWGVSTWDGQRDLWTIAPDVPEPKRTVVRVTSDAAVDWNPVWSPDGEYVYYGSDRDGTQNLWRLPIDEESGTPKGPPEPLSLPASVSGNFTFSQQGDLAFTTVTRAFRLVALPFDVTRGTTGEARPLFGGGEEILSFEASPDGSSLAFTTTGGSQEDVFVANADGTRVRQLTDDAARDRGVTWSQDGKTLYFYSNRQDAYHLWSIRADGSGLTRITSEPDLRRIKARNIYTPILSPDGRTIVAQTDDRNVLIHLDRPAAQRLEVLDGRFVGSAAWSPDGRSLLGRFREKAQGPPAGIALYTPQTRALERLLDRGIAAQWLPDGRQVLFFEQRGIGVMDLGSRRTTMVPVALPGAALNNVSVAPRLARDGKTIYLRQTLEQGDVWILRFNKG